MSRFQAVLVLCLAALLPGCAIFGGPKPEEPTVEEKPASSSTPASPSTNVSVEAPAPAPLSAKERRANDTLFEKGLAAMRENRPDEAVRCWEAVLAKDPRHPEVRAPLKKEYLARGMDAFTAGRLDEAEKLWEQVLRVDPRDDKARAYLVHLREQERKTREIQSAGTGGKP